MSSGIGGGAFIVVRNASSGEAVAFDARETAPAAATPVRLLSHYVAVKSGQKIVFFSSVRSLGLCQ
jgi:gamma-glutamyltranspeptidase